MQSDMPFAAAALRVRGSSEKLQAALADHDKLLARAARRRAVRDQLEQDLRHAVTQLASRMASLIEETRSLDEEIHAMFDALAGDRSRPRGERKKIRRLHRELEGRVISQRGFWEDSSAPGAAQDPEGDVPGDDLRGAPSAPRPPDRSALRGLFRRLAEVLHPDKVQDPADKAARTEAMKQINVAYQDGDFARLVQLERTWSTTGAPLGGRAEDDVDRRLEALETANGELRAQLRQLEREIRVLRTSPDGELAREVKRHGTVDALTQQAEEELRILRAVRDFVRGFRDRKISLEAFLDGPDLGGADEDDDEVIVDMAEAMAALVMLMHDEGLAGAATKGRSRRKGAGAKRRGR
jgi:hypothetical protein